MAIPSIHHLRDGDTIEYNGIEYVVERALGTGAYNGTHLEIHAFAEKPRPKPGDFKHNDVIVHRNGQNRYVAKNFDSVWWYSDGNTMRRIYDKNDWVEVS